MWRDRGHLRSCRLNNAILCYRVRVLLRLRHNEMKNTKSNSIFVMKKDSKSTLSTCVTGAIQKAAPRIFDAWRSFCYTSVVIYGLFNEDIFHIICLISITRTSNSLHVSFRYRKSFDLYERSYKIRKTYVNLELFNIIWCLYIVFEFTLRAI